MAERARLALEDGTVLVGRPFGARILDEGKGAGEVVFNTAITGYEEVITDPSYHGQIVVMTAPEMGNVGWNRDDLESAGPKVAGFVVRELSPVVSNWRATGALDTALAEAGVPGIAGVDTRALTQRLRDGGVMRGIITSIAADRLSDLALVERVRQSPTIEGRDLVSEVTTRAPYTWEEGSWHHAEEVAPRRRPERHVVAYDFGLKRSILRRLVDAGCRVTVVPASTSASAALALAPDGVFLSNGPGDPAAVGYAVEACRQLLDRRLPLFGICLGHQLLARALGGTTYKLKFGHHGANCPVFDLSTRRVEITSQNHNYAVDLDSLGRRAALTHVNLNDRTVEGLELADRPAFSVQYHPEASPGPRDAGYLFDRFVSLIERQR